jgi:hypothetical protein
MRSFVGLFSVNHQKAGLLQIYFSLGYISNHTRRRRSSESALATLSKYCSLPITRVQLYIPYTTPSKRFTVRTRSPPSHSNYHLLSPMNSGSLRATTATGLSFVASYLATDYLFYRWDNGYIFSLIWARALSNSRSAAGVTWDQ